MVEFESFEYVSSTKRWRQFQECACEVGVAACHPTSVNAHVEGWQKGAHLAMFASTRIAIQNVRCHMTLHLVRWEIFIHDQWKGVEVSAPATEESIGDALIGFRVERGG